MAKQPVYVITFDEIPDEGPMHAKLARLVRDLGYRCHTTFYAEGLPEPAKSPQTPAEALAELKQVGSTIGEAFKAGMTAFQTAVESEMAKAKERRRAG